MNYYTNLAKKAIENYIINGKVIQASKTLPKEMLKKKSGVFVTIKKNGKIRGCVGTWFPTKQNIAEEIINNAISAAINDYRFGIVQKKELPYLSYTVYILGKLQLVKNIKELNPKKYGVLVKTLTFPFKSALLLPDLEGIDSVEKQIVLVCQKGKINPLKEKFIIYKFKVEKHE